MTIECDDGIQLIFRTFLSTSDIKNYYLDSGDNFLNNLGTHLVGVGSSTANIDEITLYIVPYGRAPSASKAGTWALDGSLYISSLCRNVSSPSSASNNSVEIYGSNYYVLPFFCFQAPLTTHGWSRFCTFSSIGYESYKVKIRFNNYTNTFLDNFGISIVPGNINTDYRDCVCSGQVDNMCENVYVNYHYISSFQNESTYLQWQQYFFDNGISSSYNDWSRVTSWHDGIQEYHDFSDFVSNDHRQIRQTAYNPYLKFRELYKKGVNSSKEKQLRALISGTRSYASNGGGFCAFYKQAGGDPSLGNSYNCLQASYFREGSGRTSLLVENDDKSLLVGSINEVSENSNFIPFSFQNGTLSSSYFIEY